MKEVEIAQDTTELYLLLQASIDLAEIGTWSYDVTTQESILSLRMQEMYGLPKKTTIANIKQVIDPEFKDAVLEAFTNAQDFHAARPYNITYGITNPINGVKKTLHVLGMCVFDKNLLPLKISGTARDVTLEKDLRQVLEIEIQKKTKELAAANEELIKANRNLGASDQELSQYVYIASHDLQEPLRKIRFYANTLLNGSFCSEKGNKMLSKIEKSAQQMTELIRDIVNYSDAKRKDDQALKMVNLNEVVAQVWSRYDLKISEQHAGISTELLPTVEAVPVKIEQLFYNLIGNSLKFIREGVRPEISIVCKKLSVQDIRHILPSFDPSISYYDVTVIDNGIGMEAQYADQIFEIFKKLHSKQTFEGTGIGLALCRKIAENHHGTIFVTSVPNEGSSFHLILPETQPAYQI